MGIQSIKEFLKDLKRALDYFCLGFSVRDDDSMYLHEIVLFKLKRFQRKRKDKSLKLAVKLLNKIVKDEYFLKAYLEHSKKWGEAKYEIKQVDKNFYSMKRVDQDNWPQADIAEELADFKRKFQLASFLRKRDLRNAYGIIQKYEIEWWL